MRPNQASRKSINFYLQSNEIDLIDIPLPTTNQERNIVQLRHTQPLLTKHRQRLRSHQNNYSVNRNSSTTNSNTIASQHLAVT